MGKVAPGKRRESQRFDPSDRSDFTAAWVYYRTGIVNPERKNMAKWIFALLAVVVLGIAWWGVGLLGSKPAPVRTAPAPGMGGPAATQPAAGAACCATLPQRFAGPPTTAPAAMRYIPGGEFTMGSDTPDGRADERPPHRVKVRPFWMDETDVTNAQFRRFVEATGYVTTAQKKPEWEEMKKQLPPGTPKPPEDKLVAASLVFKAPAGPVPLDDYAQWWQWLPGADWRHPTGPASSIQGQDDYPVVQVSWDDAAAYAKWAGKQLPTEAQWEFAARGGLEGKKYFWGDTDPTDDDAKPRCNIWQGHFPDHNTGQDGFIGSSPVHAFAPNGYGLYDMAGNVWQWCADWYRPDTYASAQGTPTDPAGPAASFDPEEPYTPKRVMRGGSFLCHASYCASYRAAARMKSSPDSATNHTGFRCVMAIDH